MFLTKVLSKERNFVLGLTELYILYGSMSYSKLQNISETCLTSIQHQISMVIWIYLS